MRLFRTVLREIPENLNSLLLMTCLAAVAAAFFVWIVTTAAQAAAVGYVSARIMLMFAITVILSAVTHQYTLVTASQEAERLIHKLRVRIFDLARQTDLVTVEKIGYANLQCVLTQDTQTLAQLLPMLVIGFQHAMMLLFMGVYLAYLSPVACIIAFGLSGLAVGVRFARVSALRTHMESAAAAEGRVFSGLDELLQGFKEVRMSGPRADGVTGALGDASSAARAANAALKERWGKNYAVMEGMLFSLIGLMAFVVPLFTPGYHEVILPATIAVLFIVGPVSTVAFVTPMFTQAELTLDNIEKMEDRLRAAAGAAAGEAARKLERAPSSIALNDAVLSYRDTEGHPLFTVGPVAAEFHAGQITFVTGGNGSGKSTLLRMLTGLIPLDGGDLLADVKALSTDQLQDYRDRISAVFSDYHLSRRLYGIDDPDPARIEDLIDRLNLQGKVTVSNGAFSTVDLSGGQRKRLAFLVSELEDKPVIVLDELAADQDPHFRRVFYEEILPDLKARGKIVICVTHDDRWYHLADRVYHMDEGMIDQVQVKAKDG
ncbi:cyclic peptide export ABC transporter [Elusimicrobiota bacterium]